MKHFEDFMAVLLPIRKTTSVLEMRVSLTLFVQTKFQPPLTHSLKLRENFHDESFMEEMVELAI